MQILNHGLSGVVPEKARKIWLIRYFAYPEQFWSHQNNLSYVLV